MESPSRDCRALDEAVALALALLLDPARAGPGPTPDEPPIAPAAPPPTAPPPRRSAGLVATRRPRATALRHSPPAPAASLADDRVQLAARLGGGAASGLTPGLAALGTVGMEARWRRLALVVEGGLSVATEESAPSGEGVHAGSLLVAVSPCAVAGPVRACLTLRIGSVRGQGFGVDVPLTDSGLLAAMGTRIGGELPLGSWFGLFLEADVLGQLTTTTLRLDGTARWTSPSTLLVVTAGARLLLGVLP